MPITVTAPRGVLTAAGEREILPRLSAALLEAGGLAGNSFFESIVGGTVHVLAPEGVYAGGANRPVVMVELKLPDIGLDSAESRSAFIAAATDIVAELAVPGHLPENTWVNVLNARDGAWGIAGHAYTNDDLIAGATAAAAGANS